MSADRLPDNVSLQHRALANATYLMPDLVPGVEYISGWKYSRQPPDLRPFLVDEYGLAALVPYLSSYAEVLARGLPWARVRGTHSAVAQGLDTLEQGVPSPKPSVSGVVSSIGSESRSRSRKAARPSTNTGHLRKRTTLRGSVPDRWIRGFGLLFRS